MGNYTREEILQMVEEEDVEFIRLQFTDMFGEIKNIAVTARELPRALNNQCIINAEQVARMICDLYCPDGTPYKNSPR